MKSFFFLTKPQKWSVGFVSRISEAIVKGYVNTHFFLLGVSSLHTALPGKSKITFAGDLNCLLAMDCWNYMKDKGSQSLFYTYSFQGFFFFLKQSKTKLSLLHTIDSQLGLVGIIRPKVIEDDTLVFSFISKVHIENMQDRSIFQDFTILLLVPDIIFYICAI